MSEHQNDGVRTISVQALARVEGEGALTIRMRDGEVEGVELRIYEPPRFYEGFLRGRSALEVPDITARICGICPVAYQMSSVFAVERIFGIELPAELLALRRLLYCGEWIESHVLHMFMLHAPDFLGYDSAVAMAQANGELAELVRLGLRIKKCGNRIVQVVGGREVHPINVRVGGFYRVPDRATLLELAEALKSAREEAIAAVRWAASLPFPDATYEYDFVALQSENEYPMNGGCIASTSGLMIEQTAFFDKFEEYQVPYSNALQCRIRPQAGASGGGSYFVGPLARWNLNHRIAPKLVQQVASELSLFGPCHNPYQSIVVRGLEVVLALDEAIRITENYRAPAKPGVDFSPKAGVGVAATEAPRGLLVHRYQVDSAGVILRADIVPPTSQNQMQMEADLRQIAPTLVKMNDEEAALAAEKIIRNYDPCISCATHFLKVHVEGR